MNKQKTLCDYYSHIPPLFKRFLFAIFVITLLPFNGNSQSSCLTAVSNTPNTNWQWISVAATTNEYWLSFVGDTSLNYFATIEVNDTTNLKPSFTSATLYKGDCNQLQILRQDTVALYFDSIVQGQQYFVKLLFSSPPSLFSLQSTFAQPKNTETDCDNPGCDFVENSHFNYLTNPGSTTFDFTQDGVVCAWGFFGNSNQPQAYTTMGYLDNGYAQLNASGYEEAQSQFPGGIYQNIKLSPGEYDVYLGYKISPNPNWHVLLDIAPTSFNSYSNSDLLNPTINVIKTIPNSNTNWQYATSSFSVSSLSTYKLIVTPFDDGSMCFSALVDNIHVKSKPKINITPTICVTSGMFNYNVISCDNSITNVTWDFGDGTIISVPSSQTSITHNYNPIGGTYNVTVTVQYTFINTTKTVSKTIQVVTTPQLSILGNNTACNPTNIYAVSNTNPGYGFTWSISPANAGMISQNNGSNISVTWNNNNMSSTVPAYVNLTD